MSAPCCGFIRNDDSKCTLPAVCIAWAPECGGWVPCCAECAQDRRTQSPPTEPA